MNYCSYCGSDKISLMVPEGDTYQRYVCEKCGKIFYQNPRLIVGCLATLDNKILLCKRSIEPQKGLWNLPAGFLENGEKAEEGAARETKEESQAEVKIIKLHALYSLPKVNQIYLHFLAEMQNDHFGPTMESLEVKLFGEDEIPWDMIAFQSTTFALRKYFETGRDYPGVHIGSYEGMGKWKF